MNHADGGDANVGLDYWPKLPDDHMVALRDIAPGEELCEDYRNCLRAGLAPDHWLRPLYLAFCPAHYHFLLGLFGLETSIPSPSRPAKAARSLRTVEISASSTTGFEQHRDEPGGQAGRVNLGAGVRGHRDDDRSVPPARRRISAAAAKPSRRGMCRSRSTRGGFSRSAISTPSAPSLATTAS